MDWFLYNVSIDFIIWFYPTVIKNYYKYLYIARGVNDFSLTFYTSSFTHFNRSQLNFQCFFLLGAMTIDSYDQKMTGRFYYGPFVGCFKEIFKRTLMHLVIILTIITLLEACYNSSCINLFENLTKDIIDSIFFIFLKTSFNWYCI